MIEDQFVDVAPGATIEIRTAFVLADTTSKVEVTFEEAFGDKNGKITVDPSTLLSLIHISQLPGLPFFDSA